MQTSPLLVTINLPGGKAVAEIRLYDFRELQLTRPISNSTNHPKFKGN
jgi:hypothetical protein